MSLTQLSGFDAPITLLFPMASGALLTFVDVEEGRRAARAAEG